MGINLVKLSFKKNGLIFFNHTATEPCTSWFLFHKATQFWQLKGFSFVPEHSSGVALHILWQEEGRWVLAEQ